MFQKIKYVNYNCPNCMRTGKLPNAGGKFHLIDGNACQCNGCNAVYPKSYFYKPVIFYATLVE
jgi:hypothetical protein